MKSLETILSAVRDIREVRGARLCDVGAIRYDSRRVEPGDVYVAVNGRDDHGLEYVGAAIAAGAVAIVIDAPGEITAELFGDPSVTWVVVGDARAAMADMANCLYDYPGRKLKLFGVTGTNGKTTTTYVLRQLLESVGEKVGVIGTLGKMLGELVPTGYTTPESPELIEILDEMVRAGMTAVAMEVSSHALALHRVDGLDFHGAIFTNLTQDHLDFHETMQHYHDAKKLLFDRLDAERPAVVNVDDLHGDSMVRDTHAHVYRYGSASSADALISGVGLGAGASGWQLTFSANAGGGHVDLACPLVGRFNVENVTAAYTLCLALGHDRARLAEAVAGLRPVPGRMESIALPGGTTAVVDYAHTPDALENALETLRELRADGTALTVVFGCGGDRDRTKRPLMGGVAARLADRVVVTSDNPRGESPEAIIAEIEAGIPEGVRAVSIVDRALAIGHALDASAPGDIVLIAGKGHENYQIVGSERRHFDDREIVRAWRAPRGAESITDAAAA